MFTDAKNNTTQSTLTYYERSLLRKDGQAKRIGGESMKPLDSCNLCLSTVNDPVACSNGHIYCRECAISNLITQKAGIETQRREMERWEHNEALQREEARARARERVVKDFEKATGLGSITGRREAEDHRKERGDGVFAFDQGAVEKMAREAEEKAMVVIEAEQTEARKAKLAAFWLPSLAPEAKLGPLKDIKLQTLCHVGGEAHPFSYVAVFQYIVIDVKSSHLLIRVAAKPFSLLPSPIHLLDPPSPSAPHVIETSPTRPTLSSSPPAPPPS
jgi:nitric oxide synthase-interacting protein